MWAFPDSFFVRKGPIEGPEAPHTPLRNRPDNLGVCVDPLRVSIPLTGGEGCGAAWSSVSQSDVGVLVVVCVRELEGR